MPSLISGFEYDIFISYRHKDNKYDGWVSEFVANLRKELEATFKEDISIYFDENPHDGLLETHDVDKSLKGKLKSLILIPIISQTYCDPTCFAWRQEFLVFNSLAKQDEFGRDLKLMSGNVASRILPIKIHNLDPDDKKLIEDELGNVLRSVEFTYRTAGVNRPLLVTDKKEENLNHCLYRDQINKVANATKEIISALKKKSAGEFDSRENEVRISIEGIPEKSIAVLPFINMSNEPGQEYFSDGLTEEIITDLSALRDVLVISRSSMMTFKRSRKKIQEIAREVHVKYVLEGSVRKWGHNLRITARLIEAENDFQLWGERFDSTVKDVFNIQESVSRSIVDALKLKLTQREENFLAAHPIQNVEAYESYMKARAEMTKWSENGLNKAISLIHDSLSVTGNNAILYAALGTIYLYFSHFAIRNDPEDLTRAKHFARKSLEVDANCAQAHIVSGILEYKMGDHQQAVKTLKNVLTLDPNNPDGLLWLSVNYMLAGKADIAKPFSQKLLKVDPLTPLSFALVGWLEFNSGNFIECIPYYRKWLELDPSGPFTRWCCAIIFSYNPDLTESFDVLDSLIKDYPQSIYGKHALFYRSALAGDKPAALKFATDELKQEIASNNIMPMQMATGCALIDEKEEAVSWLKKAIQNGYANYVIVDKDPILRRLDDHEDFRLLKKNLKQIWDRFEV